MKLKKINAVLAVISSFALLVHMGYSSFAYLTFYYNPFLKTLTAIPFMVLTCVHAVCGMCAVFLLHDGTRMDLYGKQNKRLIIQRVSAALIFPLLLLHLKSFELQKGVAQNHEWFLYTLLVLEMFLSKNIIWRIIRVSHINMMPQSA